MKDYIVKTAKVPIIIEEDNNDLRLLKYKALREIMNQCRYLGNLALRYHIAYDLKEIPNEIVDGNRVPKDTSIYRILSRENKIVPSNIFGPLARNYAGKLYANTKKLAWTGKKSLPTYRSLFIPIIKKGTEIIENDNKFYIIPSPFKKNWIRNEYLLEKLNVEEDIKEKIKGNEKLVFKAIFNWKDEGAKSIIKKVISGEYELTDSQIKNDGKKLFFMMSFKFKKEEINIDKENVCGVDLGYNIPAVCATNNSLKRLYLGDGNEISSKRYQFRSIRRKKQKSKGLKSDSVNWEIDEKETRWVNNYYHNITRKIIDFCLQNNCGTLNIEDLSSLRKKELEEGSKSGEFKRLIWIPSRFKEIIKYKAEEKNIVLNVVDPSYTSQRCSKCGSISKENRKTQKDFKCITCEYTCNADYNAAKNIALLKRDESYSI